MKSVAHQKDWLIDDGVHEGKIALECPPGRATSETVACFIEAFGYDPEGYRNRSIRFVIDEYFRYCGAGGKITVLEFDRSFSGLEGCRDFLHLWLDRFHKHQTAAARGAKKRLPKIKFPKWYLALSDDDKRLFRRDFEGANYQSVEAIAAAYGTSRAGIYRVARKLKLTRPGFEKE